MGLIDYTREPKSDIAFIDMKSFYASVECVKRGLHPLKTSLCVMSRAENAKGLILASSPTFKKVFGKKNVGRSYELPFDIHTRKFSYQNARRQGLEITRDYVKHVEDWAEKTLIVPPRMALYIEENMKILEILRHFAKDEEICPYSIDEGFIDLSTSLDYFIKDRGMDKREKLDFLSAEIQTAILEQTGLYSTVGMSNANPLLAKLALDNEAKHTATMRANWSYEDVETKLWHIEELTDMWGIGVRTALRLNRLGIYSVRDLALSHPDILKREFGVMGLQLWFHAWGVDESRLSEPYETLSKGIGNSQILPRDYKTQEEIELILREMAEQVAIRLRRIHKKARAVALHIGFSKYEEKKSINASRKIRASQMTKVLAEEIIGLFRSYYKGGSVRSIGVRYERLIDEHFSEYTILDDIESLEKQERLERSIDEIRKKFGFLSVQKASYLLEASRIKERSSLIGGHAGGLDGLQ